MHILVILPNVLKQLKIEDMLFLWDNQSLLWFDFTALPRGQCKNIVIEHYEVVSLDFLVIKVRVLFAELCFFPVGFHHVVIVAYASNSVCLILIISLL